MKILFLTTHLNTGGITSYLLTMAKGLSAHDHQVHVASSGGNLEKDFVEAGARLLTLNIRTKSELSPKIYLALPLLKRYIQEHQINLLHSQTRIAHVMAAMLKKMTGCPHVSTCHGFFKTRLSRKLFPCWGEAVIAISSSVREHLINDFRLSRENVHLIENGIDLNAFTPVDGQKRNESRRRFNLGDGMVIGNIARLSDVKGQDVLIDALPKILAAAPQAKLLLVGTGKMEAQLHTQVKRLGLDDHVRFFTVVNRTQEMLPLFDIFVMPSRQEGLGLSIMEAQASGLPVVASRVGGIPDLIEDNKTGILVEPENSSALADAIIALWRDQQRLKTIAAAGRALIEQRFSAQNMTHKTEKLYLQTVGSNHE